MIQISKSTPKIFLYPKRLIKRKEEKKKRIDKNKGIIVISLSFIIELSFLFLSSIKRQSNNKETKLFIKSANKGKTYNIKVTNRFGLTKIHKKVALKRIIILPRKRFTNNFEKNTLAKEIGRLLIIFKFSLSKEKE